MTKGENNYKLDYYCDRWLLQRRNRIKEGTYFKYENMLGKHIKPCLGDLFPQNIRMEQVIEFEQVLSREKRLAPKTVRDILVVLKSVLSFAQKEMPLRYYIPEMPYPREDKKEMRVLTQREFEILISFLLEGQDPCKFGVLMVLFSGMRIGEICALQWKNVNLVDRTIKVEATMQRLKNKDENLKGKTRIYIGTQKNGNPSRIIPMTDSIYELCLRMDPKNKNAYVLTGTEHYIEPRALQHRMKRYAEQCNLEGVHFHTLRHTFATRCVEAGFEIKSLSEILGHSSTTITLDRYVHSSMELKRINMSKLMDIDLFSKK